MRLAVPILAAALLLPNPAHAEISPVPGSGDPRIQTVAYDANEVVALRVASGYAVTVRFSPDERIETVTLGDSASWSVQVNKRADNLVLKPLGAALASNLVVITDQRSYTFALYQSSAARMFEPYLVTFTYPGSTGAQAAAEPAPSPYEFKGEKSLWPLRIADDGRFTSVRWADDIPLPAVYRQDAKGHLALVNGVMRDGNYVIEGVPDRMVFILGTLRAEAQRSGQGDRQ